MKRRWLIFAVLCVAFLIGSFALNLKQEWEIRDELVEESAAHGGEVVACYQTAIQGREDCRLFSGVKVCVDGNVSAMVKELEDNDLFQDAIFIWPDGDSLIVHPQGMGTTREAENTTLAWLGYDVREVMAVLNEETCPGNSMVILLMGETRSKFFPDCW